MYKYGGAESGPEELRHFALSGWKQARPLPVPPEPTLFDTALRAIKRSRWTVRAVEVGAPSIHPDTIHSEPSVTKRALSCQSLLMPWGLTVRAQPARKPLAPWDGSAADSPTLQCVHRRLLEA